LVTPGLILAKRGHFTLTVGARVAPVHVAIPFGKPLQLQISPLTRTPVGGKLGPVPVPVNLVAQNAHPLAVATGYASSILGLNSTDPPVFRNAASAEEIGCGPRGRVQLIEIIYSL